MNDWKIKQMEVWYPFIFFFTTIYWLIFLPRSKDLQFLELFHGIQASNLCWKESLQIQSLEILKCQDKAHHWFTKRQQNKIKNTKQGNTCTSIYKTTKQQQNKNTIKNTRQGNTCTSISSLLRCDVLSGGKNNLFFCFYLEEEVSLIYDVKLSSSAKRSLTG